MAWLLYAEHGRVARLGGSAFSDKPSRAGHRVMNQPGLLPSAQPCWQSCEGALSLQPMRGTPPQDGFGYLKRFVIYIPLKSYPLSWRVVLVRALRNQLHAVLF